MLRFAQTSRLGASALQKTEQCLNTISSPICNTQVRHKRKRIKVVGKQPDPRVQDLWLNHKDREAEKTFKSKYTKVILIKNSGLGLAGDTLRLKRPLAGAYVQKQRAVYESPSTRHVYLDCMHSTLKQEVEEKSKTFFTLKMLERCVVIINRKIAGPKREFFWPVTRKDVANHIWNNFKIAVDPEKLEPVDHPLGCYEWKKPGLYLIHYPVGEHKARIRLYLRKGGNTWDGFPV